MLPAHMLPLKNIAAVVVTLLLAAASPVLLPLALHAEENAILYAVKNGAKLEGAVMYTTLSPCLPCARLIYSAGIKEVRFKDSYAEYKGLPSDEGVDFLNKFGVKAGKYDR